MGHHKLNAFAAAAILCLSGLVHADTPVAAPCLPDAKPGAALRGCAEFLDGSEGKPGLIASLTKRVDAAIHGKDLGDPAKETKGYYQHVHPDTQGRSKFGPTLCNLVPGPFNRGDTLDKDSYGVPCGEPVKIETRLVGGRKGPAGCYLSAPDVETNSLKAWDPGLKASSPGTMEDGYLRGALVQATTCHYASIVQELKSGRGITLKNQGAQPSPCVGITRSINRTMSGLNRKMAEIQASLEGSAANIADIVNCGVDGALASDDKLAAGTGPAGSSLRQSAQQLCAARAAIETLFGQLVSCELFARAEHGYVENISKPSARKAIVEKLLFDRIGDEVAETCGKKFDNSDRCNFPTGAELTQCSKDEYKKRMQEELRKRIEGLWPSSGARCASKDAPPLGLLLGSLAAFGARRRKRSAKPEAVAHGLLLLVLLFAGQACKGNKKKNPPTLPPTGITQPEACASPVAAPGSASADCEDEPPGDGPVAASLQAAAAAADIAEKALFNAGTLEGLSAESAAGGEYAQAAAASAGGDSMSGPGRKDGTGGANAGSANPGRDAGGSLLGRRGGSGGSGTGGSLSGSGLPGLGANTKTTPAGADKNLDAAAATADGGVAGTGYHAGGGAGSLAATGSGEGRPGWNTGSSLDGSGADTASFGGDASGGAGVETIGSADPEDYFTRMNLSDSLFKAVEKQYHQQAVRWAAAPSSAVSKAKSVK